MHVLIIHFSLDGIGADAYSEQASSIAPVFTQVVGLESKVWLADPESNSYGGVYIFESREALERYRDSDVVRSIKANPNFTNVSIRAFGTVEAATAITAGPLSSAMAG